MSLPSALQHLGVLEQAGLVRTEKRGRVRHCAIRPDSLSLAEQWLIARRTEWEQRLDRLGTYLQPRKVPKHDRTPPSLPHRACPAGDLFRAWTEARHIKAWFAPECPIAELRGRRATKQRRVNRALKQTA